MWKHLSVGVLTLSVVACASDTRYRDIGALGGAAGGAAIGAAACGDPACAIAGGVLGFLAGGALGIQLDRQSQTAITQATYDAVETNRPVRWRHPQYPTRRYGYTQPTRDISANGTVCREYQQVVVIDGREQRAYGTACADGMGGWRIGG